MHVNTDPQPAEKVAPLDNETMAILRELPRPLLRAINKATDAAPADRYRVAYAALLGCGYGDDVRRDLARQAAGIAEHLAIGKANIEQRSGLAEQHDNGA